MGKIIINQNKVTYENAQEAIKICPFGAIEYQNNKLDINSACKMCKLCVRKGPAGVFEFVEEQVKAIDKNEWQGVSVFVEHNNDKIHPVVFELIGKAKELVKVTKQKVYAVLFTDDAKKFEDEFYLMVLINYMFMSIKNLLIFMLKSMQVLWKILLKKLSRVLFYMVVLQ